MTNFGKRCQIRARLVGCPVDVIGPDVAEHEGPDADEDVDEHLDRRGRAENPASLIFDALGCVLRENQGLGDGAAGDRRAVGLDGEAHPGAGHERLMRQESLRQERQQQHFNDCKDDNEG
jgi:hypothetical protein